MPLTNMGGKLVRRGDVLSTTGECCCLECTETYAASGGAGTTVNEHQFPPAEAKLGFTWDAYTVPDKYTVTACGQQKLVIGPAGGSGEKCFIKQAGCDTVEVKVEGPEGTAWVYGISCHCTEPPPPPPQPCCTTIDDFQYGPNNSQQCLVRECGTEEGRESQCCQDTQPEGTDCGQQPPPIIGCTDTGMRPNLLPPYDCVNGAGNYGAWVTVQGVSAFPGDRSTLTEDQLDVINGVEWAINRSFFVPFACLGVRGVDFTLGGSSQYCTSSWIASVYVDLCNREVSVFVQNPACYDGKQAYYDTFSLDKYDIPCNYFQGCSCGSFGGENLDYDWINNIYPWVNGSVHVSLVSA